MNKYAVILVLLIKLTLLSSTSVNFEVECKKAKQISPERRLKVYLFCLYDAWSLSTVNVENATEVYIGLTLKIANFVSSSRIDPHPKWNRSPFGNAGSLRIHSYEVWTSEIAVLFLLLQFDWTPGWGDQSGHWEKTRAGQIAVLSVGNEDSNEYGRPMQVCYILRRGSVICAPQVRHTISYQADFTQWPFDRQNCTLVFSTWLRSNEHIRFTDRNNDTVVMDFFRSNAERTLTASRLLYHQRKSILFKIQGVTSPRLSLDLIVDRVHNQLSGIYVLQTITQS